MAKYDYKCVDVNCGVVQELVQSVHDPLPIYKKCPACGERAEHVILPHGAPAISQANFEKQTFDAAIGRDSEKRWENIRERKAKRDKVRQASGQDNLTMTGFNEFKPLPANKKLTLVKGLKQVN
jgi:putative FmdB family regulatory protein